MKKAHGAAIWVLAAVAAAGAGARVRGLPALESIGGRTSAAGVPRSPRPVAALLSRGESGADPALPDPQQRLLEQIETARLGLLAVQAALPRVSPESRIPPSAEWAGIRLAEWGGISLLATFLLGAWLWSRRRRPQVLEKDSARARLRTLLRGWRPVEQAAAVPVPAPSSDAPVLRPGPEAVALESRLRMLEASLLQVVRAVEASAARPPRASSGESVLPASTAPAEGQPWPLASPLSHAVNDAVELPARGTAAPSDPKDGKGRGPGADPDLSLPTPVTNDGRELPRIRRAVLRLAAEGWNEGKIAQKLRLGSGDVSLILRTGEPRPKAGYAEMAGSRR